MSLWRVNQEEEEDSFDGQSNPDVHLCKKVLKGPLNEFRVFPEESKMKSLVLMFALVGISSTSAGAIECPKEKLVCDLQQMTSKGDYITVATKEARFQAVNNDEPSGPPNACHAWVEFNKNETKISVSFNASISDDRNLYLFASSTSGAIGPQFNVKFDKNTNYALSYEHQKMNCHIEALARCFVPNSNSKKLSMLELPAKVCATENQIGQIISSRTQADGGCGKLERLDLFYDYSPGAPEGVEEQHRVIARVYQTNDSCHSNAQRAETIEYVEIQ